MQDYFGARYFSGYQGRFTSPDEPLLDQSPEDPQSWNLYSYVRNNPLIFVDPSGNDCVYLNSSGSDVGTIDSKNSPAQCGKTGGFWVDGTVTNATFAHGSLSLTGTTNGENRTSASYPLGADPGMLVLREAGNRASRDLSTILVAEGVFATAFVSTFAIPATIAGLTAMGETGGLGPGVGLLRLAQKYGLNLNSPKSRQILENLDMPVETFVGKFRLGSIKQAEGWTFDGMTVREALAAGARKLLTDSRFDKTK